MSTATRICSTCAPAADHHYPSGEYVQYDAVLSRFFVESRASARLCAHTSISSHTTLYFEHTLPIGCCTVTNIAYFIWRTLFCRSSLAQWEGVWEWLSFLSVAVNGIFLLHLGTTAGVSDSTEGAAQSNFVGGYRYVTLPAGFLLFGN